MGKNKADGRETGAVNPTDLNNTHEEPALICLSHLRWDFVYQRPQHLMTRFARGRRVYFVEEPIYGEGPARLAVTPRGEGLHVVVPRLPEGTEIDEAERLQKKLLDQLFEGHRIDDYVLWYYTPMALAWTGHLRPLATVYDCMDELSAFRGAPPALRERERELFGRADLVFTGGRSLYEAKQGQHRSVHLFPSSIDAAHFMQAREAAADPADQTQIGRPRIGFFGVIDERLDRELIDAAARLRPDWQFVMVGPVVKIDPRELPRRANIHYLGSKSYEELPGYIAGWDVAVLPFARNESTRFISPTKTPEYLAAGRPVVSTSIRDVVRPYGEMGLARIADTPEEFVAAVEASLAEGFERLRAAADEFLARISWDRTWDDMAGLIDGAVAARRPGVSSGLASAESLSGATAAAAYAGGD
jgi:glycosyltransferase involved in cell wall biosynthesis